MFGLKAAGLKKKLISARKMMFNIESRRYVGNKFKLSSWIKECIASNCHNLESLFDVFAGTGVVTAALLDMFDIFHINDSTLMD